MKTMHEEVVTLPPNSTPETRTISIVLDDALAGQLTIPADARGIAVSVSPYPGQANHRSAAVARKLLQSQLATLIVEVITPAENEHERRKRLEQFDLRLMTQRLLQATQWTMQDFRTRDLGLGYWGTGLGAAAALVAAAQLGYAVQAVVSFGGLPDAAGNALENVTAPTLLIVGERDDSFLHFNRRAYNRLNCRKQLTVLPRAGHSFHEPGALDKVGAMASDWFRNYLKPIEHG